MNKRKTAYVLVGGLLATGLLLNVPTMATYVQNLGTATQTINAATWNVEFGNNLKEHTIFPGDTVSDDTITLTNKNDYPVKYTITLSSTDNGLKEALTLDVKDAQGKSYGNTEKTGEITVEAGKEIKLNSHVTWTSSKEENKDISYQGTSVQYHYDIVAEKAEEVTPEEVVLFTDLKVYPNSNMRTQLTLTEDIDISTYTSKGNIKFEYLDNNGDVIYSKDKTFYDGYLNDSNQVKYGQGAFGSANKNRTDLVAGETYGTTITQSTNKAESAKQNAVKVRVTVINNSGKSYSQEVEVKR